MSKRKKKVKYHYLTTIDLNESKKYLRECMIDAGNSKDEIDSLMRLASSCEHYEAIRILTNKLHELNEG